MSRTLQGQTLILIVSLCVLGGCSQQEDSGGATASQSTDTTLEPDLGRFARQDLDDRQPPVGLTAVTPPDQIVVAFLTALRNGDDGVGEALLTQRARDETRKRGLTVQQLGSPQAKFQVGLPRYLGVHHNGAHVNTTWTEHRDGTVISYDIIWALRLQESGWRLAGMGAQLEPGQPVEYLNFEEPDEMLAKWRQADETYVADTPSDSHLRQAERPGRSQPVTQR